MIFSRSPWNWPPSITAEQTVRDLELLLDAQRDNFDDDGT